MAITITQADSTELRRVAGRSRYSLVVGSIDTDDGRIDVALCGDGTNLEILTEERLDPDDSESFGDTVDQICRRRRVAARRVPHGGTGA